MTVTQPKLKETVTKPATVAQTPASAREKAPVNPQEAAARINAVMNPAKAAPAKKTPPAAPKKPKAAIKQAPAAPLEDDTDPLDGMNDDNTDPLNLQDEGEEPAADEGAPADENDQPEGEDTEGAPEPTDEEPETIHSIVIDGKEVKVSHEELVKGYLRQADYTRKTQVLTQERKDLQAIKEQVKDLPNVQKTYQEGAERFSKNAQLVMVALEQRFMPQQPDPALAETNPGAYIKQKEHFQEAMQFRAGLQQEFANLQTREKAEQVKLVNEGRQKLFEMQPELKDPAARQKIRAYAHAHGFTDDQIAGEANPVLFVWADKARKYDEIMARKQQLSVDNPKPKVAKQNKAGEGHKALQVRKRTETIDQHRQSKSVDSAARAIAGLNLV